MDNDGINLAGILTRIKKHRPPKLIREKKPVDYVEQQTNKIVDKLVQTAYYIRLID